MYRAWSIAIALAVAALAVAGCGESKGSTATSTQTTAKSSTHTTTQAPPGTKLTHPQAVSVANAICLQLSKSTATVSISSLRSLGTTASTIVSYYAQAIEALERLMPPADMKASFNAAEADLKKVGEKLAISGRYALANDPRAAIKARLEIGPIQKHRFAIGKKYGMGNCEEI